MACEIYSISCEGIGALTSAFIAIAAWALTFYQAVQTKKHNKLSVKPILRIWTDHDLVINHQTGLSEIHYSISLNNIGIGPALIKSFNFYVDNQKIDGARIEPIDKTIGILFPTSTPSVIKKSYLAKDGALSPNGSITIVYLIFPNSTAPTTTVLEHTLKRAKLVIHYQSIYNEEFIFDSSKYQ